MLSLRHQLSLSALHLHTEDWVCLLSALHILHLSASFPWFTLHNLTQGKKRRKWFGQWKAKVYDMPNVVVSTKSRRVLGAMTDDEFFSSCNENETESDYGDLLTEDEKS
ncbi:hypothetical protein IFM89_017197 [Coptis chinensis]|uniref:Ankyrin repeat domain-containing protein n=1 Tax=Coptis chinensis TaxID=261450 RepID=A0A835IX68_9MAGN|nr:hypothetical protein IFM89_017197 [Coptis chinensis]